MSIGSINWLRLLIVCMAVASFIMGMDLHDELDYPGYLGIILAVDGLVVVLYTVAFLTSRSVHIRFFRILLRLIITSMALFGPARALNECKFWTVREYSGARGFHYLEQLECTASSYAVNPTVNRGDQSLLPTFHLFRRRCIVALAVFVLMEIEMVCYWRSDEGSEPPLHEELAAPIDIEMGDVADQRKMTAAPDSTPGFAVAH
ncbi:hypothetical protein BGZ67_000606 [Mortierella alpina]|nr:hypothetical protein BGZ67_000606 [Mortierella alpina]